MLHTALLAARLALLVFYCLNGTVRTSASIACAVVGFVESLVYVYGTHMEHSRSIHPSAILVSSLLLMLFFDAARLRTLWAIQDNDRVKSAFAVALGFKAMVLVAESWPKLSQLKPRSTKPPPEAISGVFGKVFFTWILPVFKTGYKNTLYVEEMWPIDSQLQSDTNFSRLREKWLRGTSYA